MGHTDTGTENHAGLGTEVELVDVWNYWDGPTEGLCRIDGHLYFFACVSDVIADVGPRRFAYYEMPLDKLIETKYDLTGVLSQMTPEGYFGEHELQKAST